MRQNSPHMSPTLAEFFSTDRETCKQCLRDPIYFQGTPDISARLSPLLIKPATALGYSGELGSRRRGSGGAGEPNTGQKPLTRDHPPPLIWGEAEITHPHPLC